MAPPTESSILALSRKQLLFLAVFTAAAFLLPLVLEVLLPGFVSGTRGSREHQILELLGFSAPLAIGAAAYLIIGRNPPRTASGMLIAGLPFLVMLFYAHAVSDVTDKSWDYLCYENAAKMVLTGGNPYSAAESYRYIYPPLVAQSLAFAYRAVYGTLEVLGVHKRPEAIWAVVFYFYECAQLLLIGWIYSLITKLARRLGIPPLTASLLVAALFLFNVPLLRTVRFEQVNLWILLSWLLVLLYSQTWPLLAGLAVGVGVNIKLYPAIMLGPLAACKRYWAVAASVIAILLLVVAQARFGANWTIWQQFLGVPKQSFSTFRDNSLFNLVSSTCRATLGTHPSRLIKGIVVALAGVVILWFTRRFFQRERLFTKAYGSAPDGAAREFRFQGHYMDALALSLLISPLVWEHHFVMAMPVVVWAAATVGERRPWLVIIASVLMLAIPTFDVFLFSFHRLAGLLLLIHATAPTAIYAARPERILEPAR